jgi:huntingtin
VKYLDTCSEILFLILCSTYSIDEMTTGSGGGLLTIVLSLLTSHLVSLDITAHNDALKLAGNLVAGKSHY